ncbi:MAG: FKBP-type peptidyl-prolyl cis-trans isomerase [Salinivirgaceae bacterium]|nr:FKBP-type peptidyl-prolyl cis-trans isomerase [Salinivirgaceae bacterium]
MKNIFLIILSMVIFSSCGLFERHPGYSKTKTGIYFKLQKIGENIKPPAPSDYVTVDVKYITVSDSIFFAGNRTFQLTNPDFNGSIDECFLMLSEGDSASFIIDTKDFFEKTLQANIPRFIKHGDPLKIEIRMDEIRTESQYAKDKAEFLKWIEDFGEYEKLVLSRFIQEEKIDVEPSESGMYFISTHEGTGKPVELGDIVTVNYEGKFLNGKFFDSTNKRNQPFEFVYGTEMQVIPGLEDAIGKMREGEKAIIILPSDLAWGDKGSSTGIIPPFTSVIYELELLKAEARVFEEEE